jgi:hypothetical protein
MESALPNLRQRAPVTTLRGRLDGFAAHDRLAIIRPGTGLSCNIGFAMAA